MKNNTIILFTAILILIQPRHSAEGGSPVSPEESSRIIKEIHVRNIEKYRKYRGIDYLRSEVIRAYDADTGRVLRVIEVTLRRMEYFYEAPVIEVISYRKDGRKMDPSKFNPVKNPPPLPVFDAKGPDNYDTRISERKNINGRVCYRVQVTPRQKTPRHFSGDMYYDVKNLENVYIEGTLAKLDFPLYYFMIEINMVMKDDIAVGSTIRTRLRLKVPLIFMDTMIVSEIKDIETKLIPVPK